MEYPIRCHRDRWLSRLERSQCRSADDLYIRRALESDTTREKRDIYSLDYDDQAQAVEHRE
jgi:hypothetical protein